MYARLSYRLIMDGALSNTQTFSVNNEDVFAHFLCYNPFVCQSTLMPDIIKLVQLWIQTKTDVRRVGIENERESG